MNMMLATDLHTPQRSRPPRPLSRKLANQLAVCATHPELVLFLDVETTGLSHYYDDLTLVGWSIAGQSHTLVRGEDHGRLLEDASRAKALVTFNGIRFDKRFLLREFPDLSLPEVHVDLMYLCRRVGLTGGQKSIEKELGLELRKEIADVDGFAAVLLWHRFLRGEASALATLVRYNRTDIAAMGALFDAAITRLDIHPDLFISQVKFLPWSAPKGWRRLPKTLPPMPSGMYHAPHFGDLFGETQAARSKIVGIDLTGSEKRGTGWCLLQGSHATTSTVFTDEDLLSRTIDAAPDLVSIDSPLCLPAGRIVVEDSDPGRDQFGIMRQCERELKRRGVNVYPSLLPSMQKLTARGIRLAGILRKRGIPVIESYPGAAQDIMRIPRKGAGVEWLKMGLSEFGISGDYQTEKVTHDELDAITAALVGTFHLAGLSEALGTREEPPLIIPKLTSEPGPLVIGLSGPIAAGKTTLARALERRGFAYTRFSLVIDELLKERGISPTRASRQELGAEIQASGRQRWLAEQTIDRVAGADKIVVDGMRFPEDFAFLKERFGLRFHHVYLDGDEELRRKRFSQRDADSDFDKATQSSTENGLEQLHPLADIVLKAGELNSEESADELVACFDRETPCPSQS